MLQIMHVKLVECLGSLIGKTFVASGGDPIRLKGNAPKRQVWGLRSLFPVILHPTATVANYSEGNRIDSPPECTSATSCEFLRDMGVAEEVRKIINRADFPHAIRNFSSFDHFEVSSSSSRKVCFCKLIINFRKNLLK